jgi:hypothetical protein
MNRFDHTTWAVLSASLAVVAPALASSGPPRLVKGPYLTELDAHGVTVRCQLEGAPTAVVRVVRDDGADAGGAPASTATSASVSGLQVARVAGLEPSTRYAYSVHVGTASGATVGAGHFATGPAPGSATPTTFLVYGDDRTDEAAHAAVVHAMTAVPADFLVQTGDMVAYGGSADEWQRFFDIERPLLADRPLFAAIGNHELVDDAAGAAFARFFGVVEGDAGSARVGNVRLFLLNTVQDWQGSEERAWLDRELARSDAEGEGVWRIAVMHHGPWSAGPHGPNTRLVEAHFPELLSLHKIDLLLAGHDHDYERGQGLLKYIVSGGGGAPLYPPQPTATTRKAEAAHHFVAVSAGARELRIVATRADGSVIERCGFVKGGPWDCDGATASAAPGDAAAAAPVADASPPAPPPAAVRSSSCASSGAGIPRAPGEPRGSLLGLGALAVGVGGVRRARRARSSRRRG